MNYLLFNNEVLISDGKEVRRIDKNDDIKSILGLIKEARLCVVDVDVLIAVAPEIPLEKKDSILVRKFKELYQHEAYIIQDERIDTNLFQVIGIKEQKLREIYSLIPSQKVESFIPYGVAVRNTLVNKNIDLDKTVVLVDDLGSERLLTVFDGVKFSRTRVIVNNGEDILPEIKRSQIDFFKKTEQFLDKKSADFTVITNNQAMSRELCKNTEKIQVEYLDIAYPALEGLKGTEGLIRYRLPEEDFKKRREIELKKKATTTAVSLCLVALGLSYFLFNKIELGISRDQRDLAAQANGRLNESLKILDQETYQEDLKRGKYLNYGVAYLTMLDLVPASYTVNSFKFYKTSRWNMEMTLLADDDGLIEAIPRIRTLKNAQIKDIFVNGQPGKHLRMTL